MTIFHWQQGQREERCTAGLQHRVTPETSPEGAEWREEAPCGGPLRPAPTPAFVSRSSVHSRKNHGNKKGVLYSEYPEWNYQVRFFQIGLRKKRRKRSREKFKGKTGASVVQERSW